MRPKGSKSTGIALERLKSVVKRNPQIITQQSLTVKYPTQTFISPNLNFLICKGNNVPPSHRAIARTIRRNNYIVPNT